MEIPTPLFPTTVAIPRWLRFQMQHRLQELAIPAHCSTDGHLHVEIRDGRAAIQLWSVGLQFRATRAQLVSWLDHCWRLSTDERS